MRRISIFQRRARLGVRHLLAQSSRATRTVHMAEQLLALHATDPASVMLAAIARSDGNAIAQMEYALYEQRSLIRLLGMRRTMFVVPTAFAPVVQASSTAALVPKERRKLEAQIEGAGISDDGAHWLREVQDETLAALQRRGRASATQLADDVAGLREQILVAPGKPYEATQRLSTRVLFLLAAAGHIVRGRPSGSWTSTQYQWEPASAWLPDGWANLPVDVAQAELVRRWLWTFGPAAADDVKWWTGWTMRETRRALAAVGAVEVELDDGPGVVLPDDLEPVAPPSPWVALLPALDSTPMGWARRDWYLGAHRAALFDRSGNIGPTVWCDGRVVGGWAQGADGEIRVRLLEDIGGEAATAVDAAAAELCTTLGAVRVTPRFRTPLERELAA